MPSAVDRRSGIQSQTGFLLESAVASEASLLDDWPDLLSEVNTARFIDWKLECVKIRIDQFESSADWATGQTLQSRSGRPSHRRIDRISDERLAILEGKALDGGTLRIGQFDPDGTCGAGRSVDDQPITSHRKYLGRHPSCIGIGMDGGKSIEAQSESPKWGRVEGHFAIAGLDDMPSGIVRAVSPPIAIQSWPEERLAKRPVEGLITPGGHEKNVRSIPLIGKETRGGCDVDMGGAKVRVSQRSVEMLIGQIRAHRNGFGPIDEVFGGCAADRTQFSVEEVPEEAHVVPFVDGPERDILRIERVLLGVLNHRFIAQL